MAVCRNTTFKVGMIETGVGMFKLISRNGTEYQGMEYEILKAIANKFHSSYSVEVIPNFQFGTLLPNKTWTGLVGKIASGELDMGISALSITDVRMNAIDFSAPYLHDEKKFFIHKNDYQKTSNAIFFIDPFNWIIWLLFAVFALTFALYLILALKIKLIDGFLNVLSSTLGQESRLNKTHATLVVITWFAASKFVSTIYGSKLTSSVSYAPKDSIDTLERLAECFERGEFKLGVQEGSSNYDYVAFKSEKSRHGNVYLKSLRLFDGFDGFAHVLQGNVAYLMGKKYFSLIMEQIYPGQRYHAVRESIMHEYVGIGLRRNFPCREEVDRVINVLWETAILQKWDELLMRNVTRAQSKNDSKNFRALFIDIHDMRYCGLLWLFGNALATLTLIIEFLTIKYQALAAKYL